MRVKWMIPLHKHSFIFWICLTGSFSLPKTPIIQIRLQNRKAVPQNKQRQQCQKTPLEAKRSKHTSCEDLFTLMSSSHTQPMRWFLYCIFFLQNRERKKWRWDFIIRQLVYYVKTKSVSNFLANNACTCTRTFFLSLGKSITTLVRGS